MNLGEGMDVLAAAGFGIDKATLVNPDLKTQIPELFVNKRAALLSKLKKFLPGYSRCICIEGALMQKG